MAERRMFAKTIVLSDAFLDMPLGARCLYMTMGMLADDDGFVNNPKSIMRQSGATTDDLKILIEKKFIIPFESGVIVIKHWRINNYLQKDRYQETKYIEEKSQLQIDEKGAYTSNVYTEYVYTGKDRIGKDRIGNKYIAPTLEEIKAYCTQRNNNVDAQKFYDYYTRNDWKDSKGNKVKNWKQKVITWEKKETNRMPDMTIKERTGNEDVNEIRKKLFGTENH